MSIDDARDAHIEDARDAARDEARREPMQLVLAPCRGPDGAVAWAPREHEPTLRRELTVAERIERDWRDFNRAWFGGAT